MEKLRNLFETKKVEKIEENSNSNQENIRSQENIRVTYYQSGFAAAKKATGSPVVLKTCLENVYSSFEDQCRQQKNEQEKLKIPHLKDMVSSKSDLKGLEAVKELNDDKIEKLDNQSAELKNDIIGVKVNPERYGIPSPKNPKVKFYIGLALLLPITLYLFVFYISASYSVFFKEFNDDTLSSAIFDPQALTKAFQDGILEAILILTIPFVFMGLGYIIHALQKIPGIVSKIKLIGLFIITFVFDGLLAYVIEKKIYEFTSNARTEKFDFQKAITEEGFWVIIFAGFLVYLIWGIVFDLVMKEHEGLDGIYVFVNGKKEEIRINNKKVSALNSKNDDLRIKISKVIGEISIIQSKIDGFIFPVKTYIGYHNQYTEGWLQAIGTEIALPKQQKDELILNCQGFSEAHLNKLNLSENSSQNTIYTKG